MTDIFTNDNSNIYRFNADGKEVLTPQDKEPVKLYQMFRFRSSLSPQDAIKEVNHPAQRNQHWEEAWIRQKIKTLVSGVMASPVS
jgi:hypothetical protein